VCEHYFSDSLTHCLKGFIHYKKSLCTKTTVLRLGKCHDFLQIDSKTTATLHLNEDAKGYPVW